MLAPWRVLRSLPSWLFPALVGVLLLLVPSMGLGYSVTRQIQLTLILALVVAGLNLSLGYAGQLAVGHAAMYAAGAYTAGMLSVRGTSDILVQLLAAGFAALLVGLLTGIPGLRLGSWSLAMTSFFLVLLVPDVVTIFEEQTGGHLGLTGFNAPTLLGLELTQQDYYYVLVGVAILWFAVQRNLLVSRHGVAFQVLKQSPVLASSVGMSVFRSKLAGYAVGAIPAGLAGALLANLDLFLTPEWFGFHLATGALAASILGGSRSIYGALFGAALVQYGENSSGDYAQYSLIFFGAFLLIGGVLLSGGVADLAHKAIGRLDRAAGLRRGPGKSEGAQDVPISPIAGGELRVEDVSKAFGGNKALVGVSLSASPGRVTALIGPNGSGKTTLLNLICGFYRRDSGSITIDGTAIDRAPSHRIARLGIARTFQTPLIPPGVSVRDVVISGRYSVDRAGYVAAILRSPRYRTVRKRDVARAEEVLGLVGLAHLAETEAASLPLGQRRMLEVARAVIAEPKVLLLDEAASGLDEQEIQTLASVIRRIRDAGCTVVLVEHNFGLVLSLADHIVVLARGSVLAEGTPEQIERDVRVRDEYLGVVEDEDDRGPEGDVELVRTPTAAGTGATEQHS